MLVLSRKLGEQIVIDSHIVVTVVEISPGKIRLGIEAPREILIFRRELLPAANPGIDDAGNRDTGTPAHG